MALDISVAASAQRLQVQNDQRARYQQQVQRDQVVANDREAQRLDDLQRRQEAIAREVNEARLSRLDVERVQRNQQRTERLAQQTDDAAVDRQIDRQVTDNKDAAAAEQYRQSLRGAEDNATPLASPAAPLTPTQPERTTAPDQTYSDYIAERNARLQARTIQDQNQADASERAFARSQNSVTAFRLDPSIVDDNAGRGGLVDFRA